MKKTIFILTLLLPICFVFAQDNESDINQHGNGNILDVTQDGDLNVSDVFTDGHRNASSFVDQSGKARNESDANQDGNDNWFQVTQVNEFTNNDHWNESEIEQDGNLNSAVVNQLIVKGYKNFADGKKLNSDIKQDGNDNNAIVDQNGLWLDADIDQDGKKGNASVYQGTSDYWTGLAYLSDAQIEQGVNVNGESDAEQHQYGLQNDAYIDQDSWKASEAIQVQINAKGAVTNDDGFDVNDADIEQRDGGGNRAYQIQFYNNKGGAANEADLLQDGHRNYSLEYQVGGDNYSNVRQRGNDNESDVHQTSHGLTDPIGVPVPFLK